jgi:uncharacterized protein (DUF488 family)
LVRILKAHGIERVCDVRAFPASRRHPHLAKEPLERELERRGIRYTWLGRELGGRRRLAAGDERHPSLTNAGFRAYAAHMEGEEFAAGIAELLRLAGQDRVAVMCAEAWWRRCHRSLIADHLVALHGAALVHLLDEKRSEPHRLHRAARVEGHELVYDRPEGEAEGQGQLF